MINEVDLAIENSCFNCSVNTLAMNYVIVVPVNYPILADLLGGNTVAVFVGKNETHGS